MKPENHLKLFLCLTLAAISTLSFAAKTTYIAKSTPYSSYDNQCFSCTKTKYTPLTYTVKGGYVYLGKHRFWVEKYGHGKPAVVLINGGGETSREWNTVIPQVAKFTTVVAYDHQGLGKTPTIDLKPRNARDISQRLKQILLKANVQPPYVLVGHSIGGLYIDDFARRYPQLVAGIVMLDGNNAYQVYWDKLDASKMKPGSEKLLQKMTRPKKIYQTAMNQAEKYLSQNKLSKQDYARLIESLEVAGKPQSAKQILQLPSLPHVPLISLYEGSGAYFYLWRTMMKQYVQQVPGGQAEFVKNSSHHIMIDQPEEVIQAIHKVVNTARKKL